MQRDNINDEKKEIGKNQSRSLWINRRVTVL